MYEVIHSSAAQHTHCAQRGLGMRLRTQYCFYTPEQAHDVRLLTPCNGRLGQRTFINFECLRTGLQQSTTKCTFDQCLNRAWVCMYVRSYIHIHMHKVEYNFCSTCCFTKHLPTNNSCNVVFTEIKCHEDPTLYCVCQYVSFQVTVMLLHVHLHVHVHLKAVHSQIAIWPIIAGIHSFDHPGN